MTKQATALLRVLTGLAVTATALTGVTASAADYPSRPISLIVPYPAGGGADQAARTLGVLLEKELGQPINVINRGGGAGVPGTTVISKSKPDGYTLGLITSDISLYKPQGISQVTYADVTPISQTSQIAAGVNVIESSPYTSMEQLVADIKSKPSQLKATGAAPGVGWHVAFLGLMLDLQQNPKDVIWVPTQSGTAGHLDVAAGNSTFSTSSMAEARALIDAKKIRPLAVMSPHRLDMFPDVPTLKESTGVDWNYALWHGLVGPKDMPKEVLDVLGPAVKKVVESEEFRKPLADRGFEIVTRSGDEFGTFMASDLDTMSRVLGQIKN